VELDADLPDFPAFSAIELHIFESRPPEVLFNIRQ